ncbi:MAG: hypothetical protein KDK29_09275 [Sedimentitalea sp.]|nr:hypothetical protein [Sedimentitalea sp.]
MTARLAPVLALALIAGPALSQEQEEGRGLMDRGVDLFFEGLRQEMSPLMESLRGMAEDYGPSMRSFIEEMGPAFGEMLNEVKDWTQYDPPEILPNGDIIIRKKRETAPETPHTPEPPMSDEPPAGQIDL